MNTSNPTMQIIVYHGIRPGDPGGRNGLANPERGWRVESQIGEFGGLNTHGFAKHLEGRISPEINDQWWMLDIERYKPFGLTLAQTYCYLTDFNDKPLSDEKLGLLQQSLDRVRRRGLKSLLRFAYEYDMEHRGGPTLERILQHLDQLAPVIQDNRDIIYVMHAGFVGAWGEWHNSTRQLEADHGKLAAIISKLLEVLPAERMTQLRVPKYKRWVLEQPLFNCFQVLDAETAHTGSPTARIGFHNDGFLAGHTCGYTWTEPPYYSNPGNPEFDYMTAESPYVAVDGELFWGDIDGQVDGLRAIRRLRLHHYSSFSISHSYSGREGKSHAIDKWMREPFTLKHASDDRLPLSDGYFQDAADAEAARTVFEYITDHLGYRFEIQRAQMPSVLRKDELLSVEVELINHGFAVLHNPRPVHVALIDAWNRPLTFPIPAARPCDWQPFQPGDGTYRPLTHRLTLRTSLPATMAAGWYQLGLWMPDASERLRLDSRYAVRLANRDTPWWTDDNGQYGVNIMGIVRVT